MDNLKIAIFSAQSYDKIFLSGANQHYGFELIFFEVNLTLQTAPLASGFTVVSCFVTDKLDQEVLRLLSEQGRKFIALRSAGFNHIHLISCATISTHRSASTSLLSVCCR